MVNVMYIKSSSETDYYIENKNFMEIISISQEDLYVMAEDEGMGTEGAYKIINIDKRTFEKMKELSKENKRKELTDILKDVHNKNKEVLEKSPLQFRIEESRYHHNKEWLKEIKQSFRDHYRESKAILD